MNAFDGPAGVISPHLDDAVLACGGAIAATKGCLVVTIFAGAPPSYASVTSWDQAAGFVVGEDVIQTRRQEDARAVGLLGAHARWLEFRDSQYGPSPACSEIEQALRAILAEWRPRSLLLPLGLFHSDHLLASDAGLALIAQGGLVDAEAVVDERDEGGVFAYEDALYRRLPGAVQQRLSALANGGICATPVVEAGRGQEAERADAELKRRAVECYASQLRALATPGRLGHEDAFHRERYWKLGFERAATSKQCSRASK